MGSLDRKTDSVKEFVDGLGERMDTNAAAFKESVDGLKELITTNAAAFKESVDGLGKRMDTNATVNRLVLEVSRRASGQWIAILTLIFLSITAAVPIITRFLPR
jgi:hypothetical protein